MIPFAPGQATPVPTKPYFGVPAKWLGVAVAFIAIIAFCPIPANDFMSLDDGKLVSENPDFNPPTPSHWGHYWSGPAQHEYMPEQLFMPITYMFWGVVSFIAQTPDSGANPTLNPVVFHGVSLLLHAINSVLIFLILRKLVPGPWPAFFGALLFAVHPLQTETVAWVAETSILLSSAFSLLAILEFQLFTDQRKLKNNEGKIWNARIHYGLSTIALALALLSKAPAVVVPPLVLIIEILFRRTNWRILVAPMIVWGAMCVPIALLTHHWQVSHFTVPVLHRPIVAADALAFYLYKFFLPMNLLPNYGRTPAWLMSHHVVAATTWLIPFLFLIVCIFTWRKARWIGVSSLLFAVALFPVLGLNVFVYQRFSTTADRYVYLALLGPALALSCIISLKPRLSILAVAGVLIAVLTGLSIRQATFWSDSLNLFTRVIAVHPDSQQGQEQVAVAYDRQSRIKASADDKRGAVRSMELARDHFLIAASLPGDDSISSYNAALCELYLGHYREAMKDADAALNDPKFPLRAKAYLMKGSIDEKRLSLPDQAEQSYRQALVESEAVNDAGDRSAALAALRGLELRRAVESKSGRQNIESPTRPAN